MQCLVLQAQHRVSGRVLDADSREPLAFANLIFNGNSQLQTVSDVDGNFVFVAAVPLQQVAVRYMGYRPLETSLSGGTALLLLQPSFEMLDEVRISGNDAEAVRVIKHVMAHKEANNPQALEQFSYDCYNKTKFDFLYFKNSRDSITASKAFGNGHLLLTETFSKRQYKKPVYDHEEVLATQISGIQNPAFAALATDFQPFSFYEDYIRLMDLRYLNPIAKGALSRYRYKLENTRPDGNDTIFTISFAPKKGVREETLQGVLNIHSGRFALVDVTAHPSQKTKVYLQIRQQYQKLSSGQWFPQQLHSLLTIDGYPNPTLGIYAEGRSVISNVNLQPDLKNVHFKAVPVTLLPGAAVRDSSYWKSVRHAPLDASERETYRKLDSLGKATHLDRYIGLAEKMISGRIPLGVVDLDLNKMFSLNHYEGFRAGVGMVTNEKLLRNFEFGAYAAYGFKDRAWKYGGSITATLLREPKVKTGISYRDDLRELSRWQSLEGSETGLLDLRRLIGSRYDGLREAQFFVEGQAPLFWQWRVQFTRAQIVPRFAYAFADQGDLVTQYTQSELGLQLRYQYGGFAKTVMGLNSGSNYPLVQLQYFKGLRALDGRFAYDKVTGSVQQAHYFRHFGLLSYLLEGGYSSRSLPAGLLFSGAGGYDPGMVLIVRNHFQTMRPYEFLSDRYVHLFLQHNFGRLLYSSQYFQPEFSIMQHSGWGSARNPARHQGVFFRDMRKGFFESGVKLDNIIRANYLNLGTMGLGAAAFFRYGPYANALQKENITFKATLTFSVR